MNEQAGSQDLVTKNIAWLLWRLPTAMIVAGIFWQEAIVWLWTPALLVMGASCVKNAIHCKRLHCYISGPIFLLGAAVTLLNGLNILSLDWNLIGLGVLAGAVIAYLPEWITKKKYLKKA